MNILLNQLDFHKYHIYLCSLIKDSKMYLNIVHVYILNF